MRMAEKIDRLQSRGPYSLPHDRETTANGSSDRLPKNRMNLKRRACYLQVWKIPWPPIPLDATTQFFCDAAWRKINLRIRLRLVNLKGKMRLSGELMRNAGDSDEQLDFKSSFLCGSQRRWCDWHHSTHQNIKLKSIRFRLVAGLAQSAHYNGYTGGTKVLQDFWDTLCISQSFTVSAIYSK